MVGYLPVLTGMHHLDLLKVRSKEVVQLLRGHFPSQLVVLVRVARSICRRAVLLRSRLRIVYN